MAGETTGAATGSTGGSEAGVAKLGSAAGLAASLLGGWAVGSARRAAGGAAAGAGGEAICRFALRALRFAIANSVPCLAGWQGAGRNGEGGLARAKKKSPRDSRVASERLHALAAIASQRLHGACLQGRPCVSRFAY